MRPRPALPDGPYLVVGLARSGLAAARLLQGHGEVLGVDSGRPEGASALDGVEVLLGSDGVDLLDRVRTVVKSPGVPQSAPVLEAARTRGIEVTGELEVAWRLSRARVLAVTGTNGKTTTCELLGAMFGEAGEPVTVAGNVGLPLAAVAGGPGDQPDATVVLECSSFQLEDSSAFAPECAVLLGVSTDHLDRHGSFDAYRDAKLRIFANQGQEDVAVVPVDEQVPGRGRRVTFGAAGADLDLRDGWILWGGERLIHADDMHLREAHRWNGLAASAAALDWGLDPAAVAQALRTFAGVPHRLEEVAERGGVLFVNDSKATNVASAVAGIGSFHGGVHAILGGRGKDEPYSGLSPVVADRCRACYLIGEAAEQLAAALEGAGVPLHRCGDLERAVSEATRAARPGEVVLLSPACASYDQYESFERRGEHFRELARSVAPAGE